MNPLTTSGSATDGHSVHCTGYVYIWPWTLDPRFGLALLLLLLVRMTTKFYAPSMGLAVARHYPCLAVLIKGVGY